MKKMGKIYGVGVGPGAVDLLSVRADKLVREAKYIAFFRKAGRAGHARQIASALLSKDVIELAMEYPITTEIPLSDQRYSEVLSEFYKKTTQTVLSVAVVPVGLTKFRPENDGLKSISSKYALKIIQQVERIQASLQINLGTRFCWLADEWYLIAGRNLPSYRTYENMPQESNGVGKQSN